MNAIKSSATFPASRISDHIVVSTPLGADLFVDYDAICHSAKLDGYLWDYALFTDDDV